MTKILARADIFNDSTIAQVEVDTIHYYNIGLARHDIILAEGLLTEIYLETGGRNAFESTDGAIQPASMLATSE